jgi:hypothetical protein
MEDRNSKNKSKLKRILRHLLIWVIVGFGVLVTLILILMPFGMDYGIERYFLTQGAYQTDVEDVDFDPFTRRLVIKNLIVKVGNENVLTVAKAGFKFAWSPLFKKRFLVQEVDLSDSDIAIEELRDGRWRIAGLLPGPSADTSSASSWGFGLVKLQVHNSRVKLRSAQFTSELSVEQARMRFGDVELADENFTRNGTAPVKLPAVSDELHISAAGQLEGKDGFVNPPVEKLAFQHSGLNWNGKFVLAQTPETTDFTVEGEIKIQEFKMATFNVNLAEESLSWNGSLKFFLPENSENHRLTTSGKLESKRQTITPTFRTDVRLKEARLTNVNSYQPEQASPITLEAESRKYKRLKLWGKVQPFTKRFSMDLKGLTLATLSYLKYALGPYGTAIAIVEIGAKVGKKTLTGIRLKPVEFQPGASGPDPATMEYLNKVAVILKEKKDLRLRLCGWATESDRMGPRAAAPEAAESSGSEPLEKKSAPGKQSASLKVPALSDEAMLALAERRADLIEDILVSQHGIKDKRIFICKPEIDNNPEAKPRVELVF